jgi:hypothetical protein
MKRTLITGIATATFVAGGLGLAGLGLGAGTAHAEYGPQQWCPGQSMDPPTGPGSLYNWDMSICHTWYRVDGFKGNVPFGLSGGSLPSNVWDGDNPPPGLPPPPNLPLWVR